MVNSISFSSDLNTLFLIEESQVVAFSLSSKRGVVIGKVDDQLIAATHNGTINKKTAKVKKLDLNNTQLQFFYSTQYKTGHLIIIDVAIEKDKDESTSKYLPKLDNYNLDRENLILKRVENEMTIIRVPKKTIPIHDVVKKPF